MYKPKSVKSYLKSTYLLSPREINIVLTALKMASEFAFYENNLELEDDFSVLHNKIKSECVPNN